MLNAYPAAFGCHKSKTAIFKLINVKDHGIQKTRTTPAGNGKQLQILTFLDYGRESVCKLVCTIGDCLGTPGRLEDLPGGFFLVFGELTENFTRRRNDQLLKKVRSLATVTCGCLPWPDGSIVFFLEDFYFYFYYILPTIIYDYNWEAHVRLLHLL